MNKRELIKELQKEAKDFVPDVRLSIINTLDLESKHTKVKERRSFRFKSAIAFVCLLLLIPFLQFLPTQSPTNLSTVVTLSVNPAFELEVDEDNHLSSIRPLNLDAIPILEELNLEMGVDLEVALQALINELALRGYVNLESEVGVVQLQVLNEDPVKETLVLEQLEREMNDSYIVYKRPDELIREEAEAYNVSPNKLLLVHEVLKIEPTLTKEEALELTIKELNEKVNHYKKTEIGRFQQEYREHRQGINGAKNKVSQEYSQSHQQAREKLSTIEQFVRDGKPKPMIDKQISQWVDTYLEGYSYELTEDLDYLKLLQVLEDKLDVQSEVVNHLIQANFTLQVEAFHQKIRQDLGRGKKSVDFVFEANINLSDLRSGRYNRDELVAFALLETFNSMVYLKESNQSDLGLNSKMETVQNELIQIIESGKMNQNFKDHQKVKDFVSKHHQNNKKGHGNSPKEMN